MITVKNGKESEIVVKKSKFISKAYNINSIDDALTTLEIVKEMYPDATHICYAFVVNSYEKCSDDGEPSKTAGQPILNVIKKMKLSNVLIVVVRYFGGTKLGTGGLVKCYTESAKNAIECGDRVEITKKININAHISFDKAFNIYVLSTSGYVSVKNRVGNDFLLECEIQDKDKVIESLENLGCTKINVYEVLV